MPKTQPTVITVVALTQVQNGLTSTDQRIRDAAESVLSALILHLRSKQATLPADLMEPMMLLRRYNADGGGNAQRFVDK